MSRAVSSRPLGLDDYRALAEFRRALRVFQRFSEDAARSAGVTPAQHQLILAVKGWPHPGSPSVSELADALQSKKHSTLELVHRAEDAGLVSSAVDPADHRRHLVSLTPVGEELLASLTELHRDELRRFRAQLTDLLAALD